MQGRVRQNECLLWLLGRPGFHTDNIDGLYPTDGRQVEGTREIQYHTIGAAQEEKKQEVLWGRR